MSSSTHRTLLLIKSNPEEDPRPAEAVRSSLGLIAGEIPLTVYLFREARVLLSASPDELEDLEDGEVLKRFFPMLLQMATNVYYEPDEKGGPPSEKGLPLSLSGLGKMLSDFDHTLVF